MRNQYYKESWKNLQILKKNIYYNRLNFIDIIFDIIFDIINIQYQSSKSF